MISNFAILHLLFYLASFICLHLYEWLTELLTHRWDHKMYYYLGIGRPGSNDNEGYSRFPRAQ